MSHKLSNEFNIADVVELVDTLSWGGSGVSRAGSSPAIGTIYLNKTSVIFGWQRFFYVWIYGKSFNKISPRRHQEHEKIT